jgi:hypothetical protein
MVMMSMVWIDLSHKSSVLRQKLNDYVVFGSYFTPRHHHHNFLCQKINNSVADSALNYIRNKQQEKRLSSDSASDDSNNDSDSQLTTTGCRQTVF